MSRTKPKFLPEPRIWSPSQLAAFFGRGLQWFRDRRTRLEAAGFGPSYRSPILRDPVVSPPTVTVFGSWPRSLHLVDHTLGEHAREGSVERTRCQCDLTVRPLPNVLDHRVAVPVLVRQGQEDLMYRHRKREVGLRSWDFVHVCLSGFRVKVYRSTV